MCDVLAGIENDAVKAMPLPPEALAEIRRWSALQPLSGPSEI